MKPIFEKENVKIFIDEDPMNPRDDDNLGKIVAFHNRYDLADKPVEYDPRDYNGWDELKQAIIDDHGPCVILPLFLMDHSGSSISTTPFNDPWDSGQIGYIYCSEARALEERIDLAKLPEYLEGEIETYDQYIRGEVYGYVQTRDRYTSEADGQIYRDDKPFAKVTNCSAVNFVKLLDALNQADPGESDSCWGFYTAPEELADAVLKGEV